MPVEFMNRVTGERVGVIQLDNRYIIQPDCGSVYTKEQFENDFVPVWVQNEPKEVL